MKKVLVIITVITAVLIAASCNKRVVPGMPLDCTPTPTGEPTNKVSITVLDIDSLGNSTASTGVDIMLHYPNDSRTTSASVISGTANLYIYDYGQYTVEILPNTINGYSNSIYSTIDVAGLFSQKTINRYAPDSFSISTPAIQSFDKTGGLFTYTITCHTNTPRRITFTVQTNATAGVQYWFEPVSETVNNGDTVQFKIFVPTYYQLPYADYLSSAGTLQFSVKGWDANDISVPTFNTNFNIPQAWRFYVVVPTYRGIAGGGGMGVEPYLGVKFNSINFDVYNITEPGERIVDYEDIEISNGGVWYDNTYWGGKKTHTINGEWSGTPIEIPFVLPSWSTVNWLRIVYDNCYSIGGINGMTSIKITLKVTWGNLVYRKTFETSYWYY